MSPTKRSERLRELLDRFGVNVSEFAQLAELARTQVERMLGIKGAKFLWNSARVEAKAAAALGMSREQFEDYLDDRLPLSRAIDLARPAITRGRAQLSQRKSVAKTIADAKKNFERKTGEPTYDGLAEFTSDLAWRLVGPHLSHASATRAVAYVQDAMGEIIERAKEIFPQAPQPPSDTPPPHVRPSGTDRTRGRR